MSAAVYWLDEELARVVDWRKVLPGSNTHPPPTHPPPMPRPLETLNALIGYAAGILPSSPNTPNGGTIQNVSGRPGLYNGPEFTDADVRRLEHPEEFR